MAAVHFYGDDERTALLGCACRDESAGMRLLCASTPLVADELNRTVHAVTFDASDSYHPNPRRTISSYQWEVGNRTSDRAIFTTNFNSFGAREARVSSAKHGYQTYTNLFGTYYPLIGCLWPS